jgi:hypothetical protein
VSLKSSTENQFTVEVKNAWRIASTPLMPFHVVVFGYRVNFKFKSGSVWLSL